MSVVVLATIISISLFSLLFYYRYHVFHVFQSREKVAEKTSAEIKKFQKGVTDQHISKYDNKKIRKEMKKHKGYSMYLYDGFDEIDTEYFVSSWEHKAYFETNSFFVRLYDPSVQEFEITFYNGTYPLYVYSYHGAAFMIRYVILSAIVAIASFVCMIMLFVHRKMRYVLEIGNEMKLIETGDFHSTIVYKGKDELTALAHQLNELRSVLYMNMVNEEDARKANEDLVTAMSHDLRTPLTSLMGYLDILQMKIYKSEEDREAYIAKSKLKAEQIKDMSNRLFNHFLLYAQKDEVNLIAIDQEDIRNYIEMLCGELMDRQYKVFDVYDKNAFQILVDKKLLERIYGNLFSNILKYAVKEMIVVSLTLQQGQAILKIKNKKKKDISKEESTHIGLKSIEKMMKDMGGYVYIEEDSDSFCISLTFPCRVV